MSNTSRDFVQQSSRWVIKIGSALLTNDGQGLNKSGIYGWVNQINDLIRQNKQVILVSSGAVAEGMSRLGWAKRPQSLHELQAAAAVGQSGLVQTWESAFQNYGIKTAQVLLTHADLSDRQRYLNARNTLRELLSLGVIPIINENDTVVTDEIRFGDNDTLAALVANLVEADGLMLLTDQNGLYTADPRSNPEAKLIEEAKAEDSNLLSMAGEGGKLGRGGMITKVKAAATAARSGAFTVIAHGNHSKAIESVAAGEQVGTLLTAEQAPIAARKQWIGSHLRVSGQLQLDSGACQALISKGSSLLSVGVTDVSGQFVRGEVVACLDQTGNVIAKGLANYSSEEARLVLGKPTSQFPELIGYLGDEELIHRDNMILVNGSAS